MRRIRILLVLAGLAISNWQAQAVALQGGFLLEGFATLNGTGYTDATRFVSFPTLAVLKATGDYVDTQGVTTSAITLGFAQPFVIVPGSVPGPNGIPYLVPEWFTLTRNGITYSFDVATTSTVYVDLTLNSMHVSGTGLAHVTGFEDTPIVFTITADSSPSTWGISEVSIFLYNGLLPVSTIPETGDTVMFAAAMFVGMILLRKRAAA